MVVAPSPAEEDRRRISRERRTLVKEPIEHVNRIKGLLASQGIFGCEPMHKDFRNRFEGLRTGDGRPLGPRLKAEIIRESSGSTLSCAQSHLSRPSAMRSCSPTASMPRRPQRC